jgi:hypothetical protein
VDLDTDSLGKDIVVVVVVVVVVDIPDLGNAMLEAVLQLQGIPDIRVV